MTTTPTKQDTANTGWGSYLGSAVKTTLAAPWTYGIKPVVVDPLIWTGNTVASAANTLASYVPIIGHRFGGTMPTSADSVKDTMPSNASTGISGTVAEAIVPDRLPQSTAWYSRPMSTAQSWFRSGRETDDNTAPKRGWWQTRYPDESLLRVCAKTDALEGRVGELTERMKLYHMALVALSLAHFGPASELSHWCNGSTRVPPQSAKTADTPTAKPTHTADKDAGIDSLLTSYIKSCMRADLDASRAKETLAGLKSMMTAPPLPMQAPAA